LEGLTLLFFERGGRNGCLYFVRTHVGEWGEGLFVAGYVFKGSEREE